MMGKVYVASHGGGQEALLLNSWGSGGTHSSLVASLDQKDDGLSEKKGRKWGEAAGGRSFG